MFRSYDYLQAEIYTSELINSMLLSQSLRTNQSLAYSRSCQYFVELEIPFSQLCAISPCAKPDETILFHPFFVSRILVKYLEA
jgi:hypothetical protein